MAVRECSKFPLQSLFFFNVSRKRIGEGQLSTRSMFDQAGVRDEVMGKRSTQLLYLLAQAKCLNDVTKHFSGRGSLGVYLVDFFFRSYN